MAKPQTPTHPSARLTLQPGSRKADAKLGTRFYARPYKVKSSESAWVRKLKNSLNENPVALATWALVIATTAVNVFLVREQRQTSVASLRPYIAYTGEFVHLGRSWMAPGVTWKNYGQTPAMNIHSASVLSIYDPREKKSLNDRIGATAAQLRSELNYNTDLSLAPGASEFTKATRVKRLPKTLKFMSLPLGWVMAAEITYEDAFGGKYFSETCYYEDQDRQKRECAVFNEIR